MKEIIAAITTCSLIFFNLAYAEEFPKSTIVAASPNQIQSASANEILDYINNKLRNAGFRDDTREYILELSKKRIPKETAFDKELIDKNIYMLIENLQTKNQKSSFLITEQLGQAKKYEKPWEFLLNKNQLSLFNSQSTFSTLSPFEIKEAIKKLCPFWPYCQDNIKPKKKRKEHR